MVGTAQHAVGRLAALVVAMLAAVPAAAVADTAYVGSFNNGRVVALDTVSGGSGAVIGGLGVVTDIAIASDAATVYVAHGSGAQSFVTPIDTATDRRRPAIAVGASVDALAVTPDGRTVLVTGTAPGAVTPIEAATGRAGTPIPADQPTGISLSARCREHPADPHAGRLPATLTSRLSSGQRGFTATVRLVAAR